MAMAAAKQTEPKRRSEFRNGMTYDRLRLTMSLRGVEDLVAMLAVTSTRMSEGSPAMFMPKSAKLAFAVVLCLLEASPTAKQARVSIANCRKVVGEVEKKLVCAFVVFRWSWNLSPAISGRGISSHTTRGPREVELFISHKLTSYRMDHKYRTKVVVHLMPTSLIRKTSSV